ncbi:hypothetical protein [Serratia sp. 14-2641]|uniref:hypothetical protein n=1 Tax=Serratia sp. 14-2641 TaxID=1841657 RepID=UPI00080FD232|nr:hypothetical protein [Serratia sp. 14-2641]OCJ46351.1 hypothetical protein A6U95_01435 [Serratia sp. 14-2641]
MKYIMLRVDKPMAREIPIIFPDNLVHADVANAMRMLVAYPGMANATVVSAGYCNLNLSVECHGKSTTLNVSSRETDDNIVINTYDYTHGLLFMD